MLKRALILLILALTQTGCSIEEGGDAYETVLLNDESRQELERDKRESLSIEDIKLGDGSLAAWGRKIRADIEVRYTDGTVAYHGPMFVYSGFHGSVFIHDATQETGTLSFGQTGIWLGINGMAVGGKRRITIERELVGDGLLVHGPQGKNRVGVRKEKLIVEATLTASCIPVRLRVLQTGSSSLIEREIRCRDADLPKRDPNAPIWHVY
ncbi:MAG: hypothetical protein NTZ28_05665 [Nitrospirae bacterium]|nr:hypothetical protein [Nitrospirota bacterium]